MSHINLVNGLAHSESHAAQLVRAPNRYFWEAMGGLRFFLCPTLVSCRIISSLEYSHWLTKVNRDIHPLICLREVFCQICFNISSGLSQNVKCRLDICQVSTENIAILWYTEVRIFRQLENQNNFWNPLTFLNEHLILSRSLKEPFSGYFTRFSYDLVQSNGIDCYRKRHRP